MATFLFKTEPSEFSFADLQAKPDGVWDGVSNASALIHLRTIRKGDDVLIYHTGDEKAIVGLARATSDAFEDPKQPGQNDRGEPKFAVGKLRTIAKARDAGADQGRCAIQGLCARETLAPERDAGGGKAGQGASQTRRAVIASSTG